MFIHCARQFGLFSSVKIAKGDVGKYMSIILFSLKKTVPKAQSILKMIFLFYNLNVIGKTKIGGEGKEKNGKQE